MNVGSSPTSDPNLYAEIAPMVERWTENPCVVGSSPTFSTISKKRNPILLSWISFFYLYKKKNNLLVNQCFCVKYD